MNYSIGEFSKKCGLSIDTLRYYEKLEIIRSNRDENNRRYYTDDDFKWASFVIRIKKTGMSIKNIQTYSRLRREGTGTVPDRLQLLFDQLKSLHVQQHEIDDNIEFVENKIQYYTGLNAPLENDDKSKEV
ncbi:MerR family transcriptional regulator [Companilactobacillus mishanensis]|uniref:MerR family transcriptional regulator n=1 Tax=Companilactobacillus mishanensis TaxID=2486008 RepID=A0ABW9P9Z3_9LACO|nr:MerR family transcriptional regulator [Companilactobacillus mishanensis]MQS46095.1 MerR family transcriptional regulator [Companilactobacillus mishanensis]